jgi:hypothetical protein
MRGVYAAVATLPRAAARAVVAAAGAKRGRRGAATSDDADDDADDDDDDDDDDDLSSEEYAYPRGGLEPPSRRRRRGGGAPGSGIGGLGHADETGGGMCWCGALDASRCKVPRRLTAAADAVARALRSSRALAGRRAVVLEIAREAASKRAALEADGVPSSRSPKRLKAWSDVVDEEAAAAHAVATAALAPVVDDVCEARL